MDDYRRGGKLKLGWISRRAPGTPQSLEALFDLINKGNLGTGAFRFARDNFQYLNDEELWQAYEMWCDGKFDKTIVEKRENWKKKRAL